MATPIFVDPARADDSGNGETRANAKKSIQGAIAVVDDGGVIKLIAGTYNDASQVWTTPDLPDKSFNVEPDVDGTTVDVLRTTEGSTGMFRVNNADRSDRTYTFTNVNITNAKTGGAIFFLFDTGASGNIVCNNSTLVTHANGFVFLANSTPTSKALLRSGTFTGCTYESDAAQSQNPFELIGGSIYFDTCTLTDNNATATTRMLQVTGWARDIKVLNCTWTFANAAGTALAVNIADIPVYGGIRVEGNDFIHTTADQDASAVLLFYKTDATVLNMPVIKGNTISSANTTATDSRGIRIEGDVQGASVIGNKVTGFAWGIYTEGDAGSYLDNICDCLNPIVAWGGGYNNFINNTLVSTDRASTGRALVLGRLEKASEVAKDVLNTFTATTFISNAAWDLSGVTDNGQEIAIAYNTQGVSPSPDYWGIVLGVDDGTDTITVDYWRDRDGVPATPVDADNYVAVVRWAENNVVENNIMKAESATDTFTFDFNPRPGQNKIDNNCYVAGTNSLMNLDGLDSAVQTDLTEVLAKWATFGTIYPDNDLNSLEEDPQLNSDYVPQNPLVIEGGSPDLNGRTSPMGAIGGIVGTGNYRSRYSGRNR